MSEASPALCLVTLPLQRKKRTRSLPGANASTRIGLRIGLRRRWQVALEWENKWFGGPLAGLSEHNNAAMEDLAEQLGHRWACFSC